MDNQLASLIAANAAFVGSHFALSHPLRAVLVRLLGDRGFLGLYSLVSFAALWWIIQAFKAVGPSGVMLWNGQAVVPWVLASLLTLVALAMVIGSLKGNPALPDTPAARVAQARPTGMFAVTRHPMMWGFALWAVAHIITSPSPRTLVTAGAMGVLALLGAHLQDRKKEALLGETWRAWEAKTSYWPRWSRLGGTLGGSGAGVWLLALAAWLAASWAHIWLANVPAGLWRWLG